MLFLHAEDLKPQGIDFQEGSQVVFYKLLFTKGQSFDLEQRQEAIAICQKYLKADILCLIVESQGNFTLWRETKDLNLPLEQAPIAAIAAPTYQNPFLSSPKEEPSEAIHQKQFKNQAGAYQSGASRFTVKNQKTPAAPKA